MRFRRATFGLSLLFLGTLLGTHAHAIDVGPYEIALQADLRWLRVDSKLISFTEGGLGLSRFDDNHDGIRIGRIFAALSGPLTETLRGDVTLSGTGDGDANALDITEAFVEWRPYPRSRLRWRSRVGAFYPPVSLENRAIGWQSPYSISPSAINTWLGEEVRTIGVEQSIALTNSPSQRRYEVSAVGGLYRWNDPMGVLLFQRGWAIHDRQSALFDTLPRPFPRLPEETTINFYREIDNRLGYYVGVQFKLGSALTARALHYDNRGDPGIRGFKDSAWLSRFDALGFRYESPTQTTLIAQWMKGDTSVGPSADGRGMFIIDYRSYFALASQRWRKHRVTARYDRMNTDSIRGTNIFDSRQSASAWTFAYVWNAAEAWQIVVEQLDLRGSLAQRARRAIDPYARERTLQFALRYSL